MDVLDDDAFLGGSVVIRQPAIGYRPGLDAVLVAAASDAPRGARVLDAGCGVGAVMLCLVHRRPDLTITGLEIDKTLAALCTENITLNGFAEQATCVVGDLAGRPPQGDGLFDLVVTNPPFHDGAGQSSPDPVRATALQSNADFDLADWIIASLKHLRAKGRLTLIARADRLDTVLATLSGRAGEAKIFPLWPKAGRPAKRVIITARKGLKGPLEMQPGLILHHDDNSYTDAAMAALQGGQALHL